jgi:branched-chain amino acid transport system permease protein
MFPEWMRGKQYLKVSGWRLLIFGAVLVVMMRFRPAGLLPEARRKHELQFGGATGKTVPHGPSGGSDVAPHR